jgi:heme/copper-type cytochrome/quinol oxidase subunit 4
MATTHVHHEGDIPVDALDGAVEEYPREKLYLIVFVILFAITFVEVMTYFLTDFPLFKAPALVPTLLLLAAIKFGIVAQVYMHLRFDKPVLRVIFYSALALAIVVYIAVMTIFRLWWPDAQMVCQSAPQFPTESQIPAESPCPPAVTGAH